LAEKEGDMEEAFISADEKNEGFIPIKQAKQVFDNLGLDGNSQAVEALLLFHYT
jgi:Ca2+-binding EF-hand superfamily protein